MIPLLFIASSLITYKGLKLISKILPVKNPKKSSELIVSKQEISNPEKITNRIFLISSTSLALATVGILFYPPLLYFSILGVTYDLIPLWQNGYKSLTEEHKINVGAVDFIAVSSLLLTGHYFIAALTDWIFYFGLKLVTDMKDNSKKDVVSIFEKFPNSVWLVKNEVEISIPFDDLKTGDVIVINAGEVIPVDGSVTKGVALVDQHILTGESQPAEKEIDSQIFASTVVLSGRIWVKVEKSGKETAVEKITEILNNTAKYKMSAQSKGEKLADDIALPTLMLAGITIPVSGVSGALAILYSYLGDGIRIVAPISTLNFLKVASKNGILIKDGRALEELRRVNTVVFDKTGTLTQEQPHVGKIYTLNDYGENELLTYAAASEYKQSHPIAKAILQEADKRELKLPTIDDANYEIGYGIKVVADDKLIRVGSFRFMEMEGIAIPEIMINIMAYCHEHGYSLIMIAIGSQVMGAIELHATIRPEVKMIIKQLQQRHFAVYIISGDHVEPTRQLAEELEIDNYFAEVLPENKAKIIEDIQKEGKSVCFIGDGINDSIALKQADVSISLTGASMIATDTAQILLLDKNLSQLNKLFDLAQELNTNLNTGLATTIVPGVIVIGGVFFFHFGITIASILYTTGLAAGIGHSMLPLAKYHQLEQEK
ncbi:heavy metal translocating P-type ATPase [Candidatus Parabeggiatoa sp. HSG14]|uniref:heavy metal translocating P-type ATPase n=1 Tax=Candidatus Parabeggiatoa sp. HSG14 TaxID=3055593 RepID=UPI0025A719C8|nr:heavy metal translocating P-type ATPase [Thiotrichales bacterium HSG14]